MKKVAIIILNWNGYQDTIECIESLRKCTYPRFKVIVVDNASSGPDVKMLMVKYIGWVDIIANDRNSGFPGGCNIGMKYAMKRGYDYMILLNNDTVVKPDFMEHLISAAQIEDVGIVGSKAYYYRTNKVQYLSGKINWLIGLNSNFRCDKLVEQDYVGYVCCLIKREVIEKIGYLDERYFFGIEEFDYCPRAKKAGFKTVFQPDSVIWHKVSASWKRVGYFPETKKLINQQAGWHSYKLWWKLFKDHSLPVLFVIPFILQVTNLSIYISLIKQGQWNIIGAGILKRIGLRE